MSIFGSDQYSTKPEKQHPVPTCLSQSLYIQVINGGQAIVRSKAYGA